MLENQADQCDPGEDRVIAALLLELRDAIDVHFT